ncbi:Calcium-dependent lipid-binding (CaLB domain) family protein [Striga hermonthica]|uniref:Calcium-dependent lipid-binding (CaLB domain) family protein n=1 Tax=Striga hermonthica TaxID=68872 RepID=A0A9N7NFH4_STRHE|nr:Calcium-dependent lipid-binding (CaLB domain) family protein [Striga hermonthica]
MDHPPPVAPPPPSSSPESSISTIEPPAPPPPGNHPRLLEISLISAQDLAPVSKSLQTYAVAWIGPTRKHTTRTDNKGHKNPTWNDKFVFNVEAEAEDAVLTVEIYTVSWFRDVLVGVVKVLVNDLVNPTGGARPRGTRFVALQIRRPSGNPQGILNMGVALLDATMRSMPLSGVRNYHHENAKQVHDDNVDDVINKELNSKIHLWRSLSVGSSEVANNDDFPLKSGSICNGSTVENGSELCSDIGPSASIVAAEMSRKLQPQPENIPNPRNDEYKYYGWSFTASNN